MLGRSIEYGAVDQTTLVVYLYLFVDIRHRTVALYQHLVLQSARQGDHTLFLGILSQELTTCVAVGTIEFLVLGSFVGNLLVFEVLLGSSLLKHT